MALSLAHQSRIRHLYPQSDGKNESIRPDSSSSASSATDWDSGHATVLRRQTQNQVNIREIEYRHITLIKIDECITHYLLFSLRVDIVHAPLENSANF